MKSDPKGLVLSGMSILLVIITGCDKQFSSGNSTNIQFASNQLSGNIKPNIILIIGDDIGYEIPTVNGGRSYSTPHLDRLAAEGMRFTQARATPKCSPSRVMLFTGKYNFRNYTAWGKLKT